MICWQILKNVQLNNTATKMILNSWFRPQKEKETMIKFFKQLTVNDMHNRNVYADLCLQNKKKMLEDEPIIINVGG